MIFKDADDKTKRIIKLQEIMNASENKLSRRVEHEIKIVRAEIRRDKEASDLVNLYFDRKENVAVLHDLRIEINGRTAHIDHLIISDVNKFYVINNRHFTHGLRINDHGEYLRWNEWRRTFDTIPSPVEKNNTNAEVLRDVLASVGVTWPAAILSFVLVSPSAKVDRAIALNIPEVVNFGGFISAYEADKSSKVGGENDDPMDASTGLGPDASIGRIAAKLCAMHKPLFIDYDAKFAPAGQNGFKRRALDLVTPESAMSKEWAVTSVASPSHVCSRCSSPKLRIEYGRYGYYFKCLACDGNKLVKLDCHVTGHTEVIRKQGAQFYRECNQCQSSSLFFENHEFPFS